MSDTNIGDIPITSFIGSIVMHGNLKGRSYEERNSHFLIIDTYMVMKDGVVTEQGFVMKSLTAARILSSATPDEIIYLNTNN